MPQSPVSFTVETTDTGDGTEVRAIIYVGDVPILTEFYRERGPARHDTAKYFILDQLGMRLKELLG